MREAIQQPDGDSDSLAAECEIFEAALEFADVAQRGEFLDRTFRGDLRGRRAMEELLAMAEPASAYCLVARTSMAGLAEEVLAELQGTGGSGGDEPLPDFLQSHQPSQGAP